MQIHGGHGYLPENARGLRLPRDLASRMYSGASETQRNIAMRYLGL